MNKKLSRLIEQGRFSKHSFRRWLPLLKDYYFLKRSNEEIPWTQIKERAKHAASRIGSDFYSAALNKQQKYLEVRFDCHPGSAFFALYVMVLQQLRFAERHGLIPIVNIDYRHNYYFDTNKNINFWENYFEPIGGRLSTEIKDLHRDDPKSVTFLDPELQKSLYLGEGDDIPIEYNERTQLWWQRQRQMGAELTAKYVRIKPHILAEMEQFYSNHMKEKRVLGVHLRGTEKIVKHDGTLHDVDPFFLVINQPAEYFPVVDCYLTKYPESLIFVATDQTQFLDEFKERYGDRVLFTSACRSSDEQGVFKRSGKGYLSGVEVLVDCLLLAKCDFLIKCQSNVGEVAVFFNPELPVIDVMYPVELQMEQWGLDYRM
ncbi:MAG: hypothetical protein GJ680_11440 [Alteromonadaceae bacterium]|nr:hypothetical protein [Alteromonadaceae bacterium]